MKSEFERIETSNNSALQFDSASTFSELYVKNKDEELLKESDKLLNLAIKENNEKVPLPRLYIAKSRNYETWNKLDLAGEWITKALEIVKDSEIKCIAINILGRLLGKLGKYDEALEILDNGIKFNPDYSMFYLTRGVVYWESHKYKLAEKDFRKCLRIKPNLKEAKNNLDNLLIEAKYKSEANKKVQVERKKDQENFNSFIKYIIIFLGVLILLLILKYYFKVF